MAKSERDEDLQGLTEAMGSVQLAPDVSENTSMYLAPSITCEKSMQQAKQLRAPLRTINIPKLIERNGSNSSPPTQVESKASPSSSVRDRDLFLYLFCSVALAGRQRDKFLLQPQESILEEKAPAPPANEPQEAAGSSSFGDFIARIASSVRENLGYFCSCSHIDACISPLKL
jgi:hypothetical protein